jgi:hypothetical protein
VPGPPPYAAAQERARKQIPEARETDGKACLSPSRTGEGMDRFP